MERGKQYNCQNEPSYSDYYLDETDGVVEVRKFTDIKNK